jgi:hypothetical protein
MHGATSCRPSAFTDKATLRLLTQRLLLSLTSNRIRDAREFVFGFAGDRPACFLATFSLPLDITLPIIPVTVTRGAKPCLQPRKGRQPATEPDDGGFKTQRLASARWSGKRSGVARSELRFTEKMPLLSSAPMSFDRLQRPVTGRDIVTILAASPLAEVKFDRLTVKSRVRNISL